MKILALDLSSKSTGYALGEDGQLQKSGCITSSLKNPVARIVVMKDKISQIIQQNKIDKIIMEQVRPDYNTHTFKILIWLQAAIVVSAFELDSKIECCFLNPSEWRAALKIKQGRGVKRETLKQQDIDYVKNKYNKTVNDDEADAIGLFDAFFIRGGNESAW